MSECYCIGVGAGGAGGVGAGGECKVVSEDWVLLIYMCNGAFTVSCGPV